MQIRPADILCHACGATLGAPARKSGFTQRALALDAAQADAILAKPASPPAVVVRPSFARRALDAVLLVATFGLAWFWLRARNG